MMHQPHQDCQNFLEKMSAYIDGELDEAYCRKIEAHLETCRNCRIVLKTLKKTIDLYQLDGEKTTLPSGARRRLLACLSLKDDSNHGE